MGVDDHAASPGTTRPAGSRSSRRNASQTARDLLGEQGGVAPHLLRGPHAQQDRGDGRVRPRGVDGQGGQRGAVVAGDGGGAPGPVQQLGPAPARTGTSRPAGVRAGEQPEANTPPSTTAVPARWAAGNNPSAAEASSRWYRPATRTTSRSNSSTNAVSGAVSFMPAPTARTIPSSRIRSSSGNARPARRRGGRRGRGRGRRRSGRAPAAAGSPRPTGAPGRGEVPDPHAAVRDVETLGVPARARSGDEETPTLVSRTNSSRGRSRRAAPTRSSLRPTP